MLIGLFLTRLAAASVSELMLRSALNGLSVDDAMRTRFDSVPPETTVDRFIDDYLLRSDQRVWPVAEHGPAAFVTLGQVLAMPEVDRRRVIDVARRLAPGDVLSPSMSGRDAILRLAAADDEALPVIRDDTVVGLLHRGDVYKWIVLHAPP